MTLIPGRARAGKRQTEGVIIENRQRPHFALALKVYHGAHDYWTFRVEVKGHD
jgi:hypothetical protein